MRTAGTVLWRDIAERLAADIRADTWRIGERLPPEDALAARFGVNRHTLRQAVASLAEAGLIRVRQGRGTFVNAAPALEYRIGAHTRYTERVTQQNRLPDGRLLGAALCPASAEAAARLACAEGTSLVVLELLRMADGLPISLVTTHFPAARFTGIETQFEAHRSVTQALWHFGIEDYRRSFTRVSARLPRKEETGRLNQPVREPLIVVEGVNVDPQGCPIEYSIARCPAERLQVVMES
jgi:GntR family phosphonate transport system transcriptional regulator